MTEKELMKDEATLRLAIAMKKMSVEYNIPVSEMISEGHRLLDWLIKLPTVSTPNVLNILESAKDNTQNEYERQCLDNLSEVLSNNPCTNCESSNRITPLRLSFMLAAMSTLTID